MSKIYKCLFLLIFSGVVLSADADQEDDWQELSNQINLSLEEWGIEVANLIKIDNIQTILKSLKLINEIYDSESFKKIKPILSTNKEFIANLSQEESELLSHFIREKFSENVSRSSINILTKMRSKNSVNISKHDKENKRPIENHSKKEHPAIRRIKEEY